MTARRLGAFDVATRAGAGLAVAGLAVAAANAAALPRLRPGPSPRPVTEPVTVIVPARDEAHRVADVVADLRAQRGLDDLRVLVLDDDSSDATTAVAHRAVDGDERFALIRSTAPPPAGWLGKTAACHRAARHATRVFGSDRPGVLVFVDADVRLAPDALATAVGELRCSGADLVSPWPRQDAGSAVERLIQPLLCWSWFATLPVALAHRTPRPSTAVACGQFLVFDAAAYDRIGGHAAVAGDLAEDLGLARALRRQGRRTVVAAAGAVASCRMYTGRRDLMAGHTRWLWTEFGGPTGATVVAAVSALAYVLPPAAVALGRGRTRLWGAAGYGAAVASRLTARAVEADRRPTAADLVDAAAHPVSVVGLIHLIVASHRGARRGHLRWKGRAVG